MNQSFKTGSAFRRVSTKRKQKKNGQKNGFFLFGKSSWWTSGRLFSKFRTHAIKTSIHFIIWKNSRYFGNSFALLKQYLFELCLIRFSIYLWQIFDKSLFFPISRCTFIFLDFSRFVKQAKTRQLIEFFSDQNWRKLIRSSENPWKYDVNLPSKLFIFLTFFFIFFI